MAAYRDLESYDTLAPHTSPRDAGTGWSSAPPSFSGAVPANWSGGVIAPTSVEVAPVSSAGATAGSGVATNSDPWASFYSTPIFDDPATAPLETWIKQYTQQLLQPRSENDYGLGAALNALKGQLGGGAPGNAYERELVDYAHSLQQTPFTAGDEAVMRANAFDSLERARTAAIERAKEQSAARGLSYSSGPTGDTLNEVNRQFDTLRAQNQNALMMKQIETAAQRKAQAAGILEQLGSEGANRALAANNQTLSAAQLLGALSQQAGGQDYTRGNTLLSVLSILPELARQRQADAVSTMNGTTPNAASVTQLLSQLSAMNQNASQYNDAQTAALLAQLGQYLASYGA